MTANSARLVTHNHASAAAAMAELGRAGFTPAHRPDGFHLFTDGRARYAIARYDAGAGRIAWAILPESALDQTLRERAAAAAHPDATGADLDNARRDARRFAAADVAPAVDGIEVIEHELPRDLEPWE